MDTKLRIEISDFAYDKITELLSSNKEYSYLRFTSVAFCGSKSNIDLMLDNKVEEDDERIAYKDLVLLYKKENLKDYEFIFVIYEDNTFKVKGEKNEEALAVGCGCSSGGGGGCGSSGGCGSCGGCGSH